MTLYRARFNLTPSNKRGDHLVLRFYWRNSDSRVFFQHPTWDDSEIFARTAVSYVPDIEERIYYRRKFEYAIRNKFLDFPINKYNEVIVVL